MSMIDSKMVKSSINERIRIDIATYLLQDIVKAMHGRDMKTGIKKCVMDIQKERSIPTLKFTENENLLRIDIPDTLFLEFDLDKKTVTIQLLKKEVMMSLPENDVRSIKTAGNVEEKKMSLVDIKIAEFNMMGLEPNIENAVILAIYDITKSFKFMQITDATLETIKGAIMEECGSYISDLTLKPIACEGAIEVMFKMDGRTIMRQVFLTRNVEMKKRSFSED